MRVDVAVITCPPLPTWNDLHTNTTDVLLQTYVRAECSSNHRFDISNYAEGSVIVAQCVDPGVWQPSLPACAVIDSEFAQAPPPTEAENAPQIASAILFVMLAVGVFIVVVDVLTSLDTARFMLATNLGHMIPLLTHPQVHVQVHAGGDVTLAARINVSDLTER